MEIRKRSIATEHDNLTPRRLHAFLSLPVHNRAAGDVRERDPLHGQVSGRPGGEEEGRVQDPHAGGYDHPRGERSQRVRTRLSLIVGPSAYAKTLEAVANAAEAARVWELFLHA